MLHIADARNQHKVAGQVNSHAWCCKPIINSRVVLNVVSVLFHDITCCVFGSHEADDSPGECSSEPEHQHGQHPAPV